MKTMKRTMAFGLFITMLLAMKVWVFSDDMDPWPFKGGETVEGHWVALRVDNTNGGQIMVNWSVVSTTRGVLGSSPDFANQWVPSPFDTTYHLAAGETLKVKLHGGVSYRGATDVITCLVVTDKGPGAHDRYVKREPQEVPDVNCNATVVWAG